jgi:hypothetical protein
MKRTLTLSLVGTALALVASLLLPVPAGYAASVKDGDGLQPCIDLALKQRVEQWVCSGAGLTSTTRDAKGNVVTETTSIGFKVDYQGYASIQDDYDTWCEYGSVCHRFINSSYIEEVKGNAAYGNSSGAIGSFDVILRTNLNGRQARWNLYLIWDSGPNLNFLDDYVSCIQIVVFWPDISCGHHYAGNVPILGPHGYRYNSPTIYGNWLANAADYKGEVTSLFVPDGYPAYGIQPLDSLAFTCPSGDGVCHF